MSDANFRTSEDLKHKFAVLQLLFSVQKYVIEKIIANISEVDFNWLRAGNELILPFDDTEVIVNLEVIDKELGDFISLVCSLNQLGEELNVSFDITRNDVFTDSEYDPSLYPFLISISAFPEEHFTESTQYYMDILGLRVIGDGKFDIKRIISTTKWQAECYENN